jgi:hypothetical protein
MHLKRSLRHSRYSRSILLCSAATATLLSSTTMAAIVTSPVSNLALPQTTAGVYINVITGATGTSAGAVTGWDLNPYNTANGLGIYWIPTQPGAPVRNAAVGDTTTGPITVLAPGATIGPANTYTSAIQAASSLRPTGDRFFGFRFFNEATSAINYGYARITTTSPNGYPATLVSVVYEDSGAPITIPLPAVAPQFSYVPAPGSTVTATGGGAVGSTGTLTITPSVGTAGSGTGAAATTTLTCTAPAAPFTGFGQTVTAEGAGAISGGPLSGSCTLGAAAATTTLTCNENRGGTANALTWTLSCPAGTVTPLTSTPASGSTVNLGTQVFGGPARTATIAFQNPGLVAATVTCTAPAATQFTVNPLTLNIAPGGSASTTVTYSSAVAGNFTGTLNCSAGAQTFTFNLAGSTAAAATAVPTLGRAGLWLAILGVLGLGLFAARRRSA